LLRLLCRYGIATWMGALHAACGVYMGDTSKDASVPAGEACQLDRSLVSGNDTSTVGATGVELQELAGMSYSAALSWLVSGRHTQLHATLSDIKIYSVAATQNPAHELWSQTPVCRDHVTIEAALDLTSDDGRLAEHVDAISLTAYDGFEAHGSFSIDAASIEGTYTNGAGASACFVRLDVRLLIARDGSSGTLSDAIENGSCDGDPTRPTNEFASAHWGMRWANYGD
jgi:hypothetical protein